jgi:hypothetical protein
MPPAPLDQRPVEPPNPVEDDSSDDDDDFGPALPTGDAASYDDDEHPSNAASDAPQVEKVKRDDWMMMPPKQDDLAARMDPSVQRPRGFNTGKSARAPNAGDDDNSIWHETPEQRRKRLANEMMGVGTTSTTARPNAAKSKKTGAHEKIQEHVVSLHASNFWLQDYC